MRATWGRQPLRVRLVVLFTTLLLAALTAVGGLALTLLRQSLLEGVDERLTGAANAMVHTSLLAMANSTAQTNPYVPTEFAVLIGQTSGAITYRFSASTTSSGPAIESLPLAEVEERDGEPFIIGSTTGSTRWRVLESPLYATDGSVQGTVAVALPLDTADATMQKMAGGLVAVGLAVLVAAGAGTYLVVRSSLHPLERIKTTAAEIAGGDLSHRVDAAPPTTEVGSLAVSLNTMLGDLEQAFDAQRRSEEKMQRFVGDASHELRTPLAAVAGYTELYRLGGVPAAGVPEVMGRIEESTARMSALVADLLALARLDQGAPMRIESQPVAPLLDDAARDLGALDPTRTVSVRATDNLAVLADRDKLAQVLSNLVGNAAAYTPVGTPVELVAMPDGADAVIEVRDHGPGIPAGDRERVFERFARLDAGRARDDGGSGLGLAIARSSMVAMAGSIEAAQTEGGGTTMRLRLPTARER